MRVELGEIESHLLAFPRVTQAAVTSQLLPEGGRRLVAYVALPTAGFDPAKVRRFLRARLTHALVPPLVMRLDALPLTAAGKIDRQALPPSDAAAVGGQSVRPTPENELERQLIALWSRVLERETVGAEDDFFALGGDSLQAAVLLMSIEADLGAKLAAADLVDCPTPRELAARIGQGRAAPTLPALLLNEGNEGRFVRIQRGGAKPPILVFLGGYGVSERGGTYEPLFRELPDHPVHCYVAPETQPPRSACA